MLVESFYDLNRTAAVSVDGVTWQAYEAILQDRVHELHRQIHTGAYRAQASRRTYIAKTDGGQVPAYSRHASAWLVSRTRKGYAGFVKVVNYPLRHAIDAGGPVLVT